ncbi:MFS transporter, partial [Fibrobacterota bacterium]
VTSETNTVISQGILALAGIGIIFGSIFAGRVSKNFIETGIIPLGAIGMSVSLFFLPNLDSKPLLAGLSLIYGFFGGVFIVPLNALIQFHAGRKDMGKVLAGNNFIQNIFMLVFLACSIMFAMIALPPQKVFFVLFLITLTGTFYIVYKIPQSLIRYMVRAVLSQNTNCRYWG